MIEMLRYKQTKIVIQFFQQFVVEQGDHTFDILLATLKQRIEHELGGHWNVIVSIVDMHNVNPHYNSDYIELTINAFGFYILI